MAVKFSDGTVVQLNSGGPLMTVSYFDDERQQYFCEWFVKDEPNHKFFNEASLKEYKEEGW
ncbi:TPA: YodC family protein [Citrobacter koseri]